MLVSSAVCRPLDAKIGNEVSAQIPEVKMPFFGLKAQLIRLTPDQAIGSLFRTCPHEIEVAPVTCDSSSESVLLGMSRIKINR